MAVNVNAFMANVHAPDRPAVKVCAVLDNGY